MVSQRRRYVILFLAVFTLASAAQKPRAAATLFFVVIVAHTSLRESLAAQSLVYLEYYFFAMYIAFLGVSINAIKVASRTRGRLISYEDNLVARLL